MTGREASEVEANRAGAAERKSPHDGVRAIFRLKQVNRSLKPETQKAFRRSQVRLSFPGPSVIFGEGENSRGIYVVHKGDIKLSMVRGRTKGVEWRLAQRGEVLGLGSTVSGRPYELTAETLGPCQVSFISTGDFMKLMRQDSEFAFHVVHYLCADMRRIFGSVRSVHSLPCRAAKNDERGIPADSTP